MREWREAVQNNLRVTIRRMEEADCREVADIEAQAFSQPWPYEEFVKTINSDNYIYIVAVCDDIVCGYCGCVIALDEADITNIAVAPQYRRYGIGSMLLECAFKDLSTRNVLRLFLEVRESNEPAQSLYTKEGFKPVGLRKNFYQKPTENAILMARDIEG